MALGDNGRLGPCHRSGSGLGSGLGLALGFRLMSGSGLRLGTRDKKGKWVKKTFRLRVGSCNVGALQWKFIELVKILRKRKINIACS